MFVEGFREGLRDGTDGMAWDDVASAARWGFEPGDVSVRVTVCHGEDDQLVPRFHAEYLAAHLPDRRLVIRPGEAHLGLLSRWTTVVSGLLAASGGAEHVA
jgi:pimeloyl-ACP methyl ester carboxylesterase